MATDEWTALSARAALASHQVIGWVFWDPEGVSRYAALGVPDGRGYYIATRAAPLADAGDEAVIAAFYSIHPGFIRFALGLARQHTTFGDVSRVRNETVGVGLRAFAPPIAAALGEFAAPLWEVVDALPRSGRVLFAAHAAWPRVDDDPLVSAWLALNCIREWRGDTHFALLVADDISGVEAGLLHDAWMGYPREWIPRSRGADDAAITAALESLADRGFARRGDDGALQVDDAGVAYRDAIERRTNELTATCWKLLGADRSTALCEMIEPAAPALMQRIDLTAGPNWMPAARPRRR